IKFPCNIRAPCVKQRTHAATVQNADPTPACAVYKAKRLVYHERLKRRIFPRSDPPQTSEISEVCIRRNSVPIQRTPVRLSSGAEGFHKVRRSSHRPITTMRFTLIQLFGRLVNSCSFKGRSGARWPSSGGIPVSTGLCDKQGKSVLCPKQITHFLGMILDSTSMEVRLSRERINAIKTCVRQFRLGQSVSSLCCQRLLGMMASAVIALPLGMLRMRPFQIWYLSMRLNAVTDRHRRVVVSSRCRKALAIWRTPWFLAPSCPMGSPAPVGSEARPSLRAVHIPGHLNYGADLLSRGNPQAADWCLHPQVIGQIYVRLFRAQVHLFTNRENTCCPLWFSLGGDDPPLSIDALGHQWPNLLLYAFPPIPLLQQVLSRVAKRAENCY